MRTIPAYIAETITNSLKKSLLLKNKEIFITFSVGIALYPHDGHDAETLKNADTALYLAKEQGRNNVQFLNLSARQFIQTDLPEMIAKVLKKTKLHASFLEFEITESAAMYDVEYAIVMIKVLKEMGLKIVIDDFGTGYSSLSYLKKFPIDGLKIDRSFISGIHHGSDDAAIVTAIILLAKALNLQVTGEGVETAEQFQFLQEKECDEAQGYYFGKPMPSHIIEEWMDHENQQQIDEAMAQVGKQALG